MTDLIVAVLRRDRAVVAAALATVTAAAWAWLLWLGGPAPPVMDAAAPMPRMEHAPSLGLGALIWIVMMIGMMTPAASPAVLLYARVARQAQGQGTPFASAGLFAAGYLAAWTGFAVAAALAQAALERAMILASAMAPAPRGLGGGLLVVAGIYQVSPMKQACLDACQHPLAFIQAHGGFRGDAAGAVRLGGRLGLHCIGCCWALMGLLFVVGAMNLAWMAALTILVLAEKLVPGRWFARSAGAALLLAGAWMLLA